MSNQLPHAVGMIMDGNRRWARARGVPTLEGHTAGLRKIEEVATWVFEAGVEELTLYAFSTENWNRSTEEVGHLMGLLEYAFSTWIDKITEKNIRVRCIGDLTQFSPKHQKLLNDVTERTKHNTRGTLVFALSYGGRAELVAGVNRLLAEGKSLVTEAEVRASLWSADLRDPDMIIRTGGEHRLSGFLTWQSVYSELFFTETLWPDFSRDEWNRLLAEYQARERRNGI